ncbi:MAG TPA: branched-chain amino acid ABC transporter permease [Nocardioidaceae bacterium]|jgi:branched-chain amino acid transport system permease protein|nr:branched-chain amino acid ABC transporter permease [Nocardioidaceae bacterium]
MNTFLNLTVYGLSDGAILALAALGFVLIYKATGVINFAQGEFLLVGAYTVYAAFVVFRLPLGVAVLVGVVFAVILGVVIERLVLRPLVGESAISVIMVTIGLAALLRAVVQLIFGTRPVPQPPLLPRSPVELLPGTSVPLNRLLVILIAAVVLVAFTVFFRRSRHGIAMRAVADDQQAALTMGISVRRIFAMSWALAALSALVGGVLLGDVTEVSGRLATFGLFVFPVVILGGLDSVPGTIVGGLTIGLTYQYVSGYAPEPGWAQIAPYVLLVAILLVRPYGLFGETRIERV